MNMLKKLSISILGTLKEIFYCFSWGMRNYSTDHKLDVLLIYLENVEVSSVDILSDTATCVIMFVDGSKSNFWHENRWYAWMNHGTMKFSNGKVLEWSGVMPSYEVLYRYRKLYRKYNRANKKKTILDFSEYLPTKLIRKEKLKKIKLNNNF